MGFHSVHLYGWILKTYTKKRIQALHITWCHLYDIPEKANRSSYQRKQLPGDWVEGPIVYKGAQVSIYYVQISECGYKIMWYITQIC